MVHTFFAIKTLIVLGVSSQLLYILFLVSRKPSRCLYAGYKNDKIPKTNSSVIEEKISLSLALTYIYRFDISCKISDTFFYPDAYKSDKKCTLASVTKPMDQKRLNSKLLKTFVHGPNDKETHSPLFEFNKSIEFDPFSSKVPSEYEQFKDLQPGGVWTPKLKNDPMCKIQDIEHIVIIVPFSSSRLENLQLLLINLHSYLQKALFKFKYQIVVAQQEVISNTTLFNKGSLYNRAFEYVMKSYSSVDCIVLHDVDLVPTFPNRLMVEKGDYRCRDMPFHMSNVVYSLSTRKKIKYYNFLTGGILSMRPGHFIDINGFSNRYYGWGAEDDDLTVRMISNDMCVKRSYRTLGGVFYNLDKDHAPFTMLRHKPSAINGNRGSVMKVFQSSIKNMKSDGLNAVEEVTKMEDVVLYSTLTLLRIRVIQEVGTEFEEN